MTEEANKTPETEQSRSAVLAQLRAKSAVKLAETANTTPIADRSSEDIAAEGENAAQLLQQQLVVERARADFAEQQLRLADKPTFIGEAVAAKGPNDPMMFMPDGRPLWGVYVTTGEHNQTVIIKDRKGKTKFLPFISNVLFVHDKHDFDQLEENMAENAAYGATFMRATPAEAKYITDLQAKAQKQLTIAGPTSTPVMRATEQLLANTIALAKSDVAAGMPIGSSRG